MTSKTVYILKRFTQSLALAVSNPGVVPPELHSCLSHCQIFPSVYLMYHMKPSYQQVNSCSSTFSGQDGPEISSNQISVSGQSKEPTVILLITINGFICLFCWPGGTYLLKWLALSSLSAQIYSCSPLFSKCAWATVSFVIASCR